MRQDAPALLPRQAVFLRLVMICEIKCVAPTTRFNTTVHVLLSSKKHLERKHNVYGYK